MHQHTDEVHQAKSNSSFPTVHIPTMTPILQLKFFHAQDINVPVVSLRTAHISIWTSWNIKCIKCCMTDTQIKWRKAMNCNTS